MGGRDALEGKGKWRQQRLGRRLEEVAKAVGGGYCRLQMQMKPALGVRGTVAGHTSGARGGGGGGYPPSNASLGGGGGRVLGPGRHRPPAPPHQKHLPQARNEIRPGTWK